MHVTCLYNTRQLSILQYTIYNTRHLSILLCVKPFPEHPTRYQVFLSTPPLRQTFSWASSLLSSLIYSPSIASNLFLNIQLAIKSSLSLPLHCAKPFPEYPACYQVFSTAPPSRQTFSWTSNLLSSLLSLSAPPSSQTSTELLTRYQTLGLLLKRLLLIKLINHSAIL